MIYAELVRPITDREARDRLDTALNARLEGDSQEESAEEQQALIDDEMAAFTANL